jgi:3-oxoacyl-[acyl-carrier-protein] synthase III
MWGGAITEIGMDRIGRFAMHGASTRASEVMRVALAIPPAKWSCSHARFGNTGPNSIPIALAIEEGRLSRGQLVMCLIASPSALACSRTDRWLAHFRIGNILS